MKNVILLSFVLAFVFHLMTFAQSGGPYLIEKSVIASGGGSSSCGQFFVEGTLGQPVVTGATLLGQPYVIYGGFWTPTAAAPTPTPTPTPSPSPSPTPTATPTPSPSP